MVRTLWDYALLNKCGIAESQRKLAETKVRWRNNDEFASGKGKSQTGDHRKYHSFIIDFVTSLWTSLKNKRMWNSILESIKRRSIVWQIIAHPDLGG